MELNRITKNNEGSSQGSSSGNPTEMNNSGFSQEQHDVVRPTVARLTKELIGMRTKEEWNLD